MPATEAQGTFGALLQRGDGASPEVFTSVAEVRRVKIPPIDRDEREVTHHESPGGFDEYIMTLKRGGTIVADVNLLTGNTTHQQLFTDQKNGTLSNYKVIAPDDDESEFIFPAFVKTIDIGDFTPEGNLTATLTLRVSGEVTLPTFS